MTRSSVNELSASYEPLLKALTPLAERRPDERLLDRVPGRRGDDEDRFRYVGALVGEMEDGIGGVLAGLDETTSIVLAPHEVKALEASLTSNS